MVDFNMMKICSFFLILAALCEHSIGSKQHICGPALNSALDLLCTHGFSKMKISKKSIDLGDYASNEIEDELPYPYGNSPFLAKIRGGSESLLAKTRRRRHGIADECCTNGCSYPELISYCALY